MCPRCDREKKLRQGREAHYRQKERRDPGYRQKRSERDEIKAAWKALTPDIKEALRGALGSIRSREKWRADLEENRRRAREKARELAHTEEYRARRARSIQKHGDEWRARARARRAANPEPYRDNAWLFKVRRKFGGTLPEPKLLRMMKLARRFRSALRVHPLAD